MDGSDEHDPAETDDTVSGHLAGIEEGAGCTEIWEHLSKHREDRK